MERDSLAGTAHEVFLAFLTRVVEGERLSFEDLLHEHPTLEPELLELRRRWIEEGGLATASGSLAERIRQRFGADLSPEVSLDESGEEDGASSRRLLARLASRKASFGRYRVKDKVDEGGMGAILRVWDEDLRRHLAMKVILGDGSGRTQHGPKVDPRKLSRFLEEAQITGQLEHPGVVPVHDLGLDADGHVYFTMQLVKGRDLRSVLEQVRAGSKEWTLQRVLGVLIKVCQTMAFAHSKGVIHRDLKPPNVMVGRFGETYVMDWGLARILGRPDAHDLRLRPVTPPGSTEVESVRKVDRDKSPGSPLVTADGVALGTPSYMSPEQALGELGLIERRSDVYAVGAMLYHLLSGQVPYVPEGSSATPQQVLMQLILGPPTPLRELAPTAPAELVAIAEKAMARPIGERYDDMMEMAADLEAYLGQRPVAALSQRLGHVLWLAIQRNKPTALTAAGGLVVVALLLAFFIHNLRTAVRRTNAALQEKVQLVDELAAPALVAEAEELFPLVPARVPELEAWLERADLVLERRARGSGASGGERFQHDVAALDRLRPEVAAHLETARNLERFTIADSHEAWAEARADVARLAAYRGLNLAPQLGLVPLGRNSSSGLWEFWHVLSGARPQLDPELNEFRLTPESGLVLVLLPGGPFEMGSRPTDARHYPNERLHRVTLTPFFLSKYEVTQAQWERVMGENPSGLIGRNPFGTEADAEVEFTPLNPVETVTWTDCQRFAGRLALRLPTEAQWEYACRAGTTTQFCWGDADTALEWNANVKDASFGAAFGLPTTATWDDGFRYHAPVGSFAPSPFGLYDMHGNVTEWCADVDAQDYPPDSDVPGDGLVSSGGHRRINRGGSWYLAPEFCRCAFRQFALPRNADFARGLRVARELER